MYTHSINDYLLSLIPRPRLFQRPRKADDTGLLRKLMTAFNEHISALQNRDMNPGLTLVYFFFRWVTEDRYDYLKNLI